VRAIKLQQAITEGRFALPADQSGGVIETFLDEATGEPRPHLLKEATAMTDEDRDAAQQRATAKMKAVRYRDPQHEPLPNT
jgi:ribosome recycling factor